MCLSKRHQLIGDILPLLDDAHAVSLQYATALEWFTREVDCVYSFFANRFYCGPYREINVLSPVLTLRGRDLMSGKTCQAHISPVVRASGRYYSSDDTKQAMLDFAEPMLTDPQFPETDDDSGPVAKCRSGK
jgi:hypothetical protein